MTFNARFLAKDRARSVLRIALFVSATLLAAALVVMMLGGSNVSLAASKTFIVNVADDVDDGSCNPQHCSLREAINQANTNGGPDFVYFDIAGTPPYTISVTTNPLPPVTDPVTIDGTSEPDYVDVPIVVVDGSGAPTGYPGLHITSGSTLVTGLVIHSFTPYGILIETAGGNTIAGNFIGTDASGTIAKGNSGAGVFIDRTSNNTIGGTLGTTPGGPCTGACNLISGNAGLGVAIQGASATNNRVLGNFVGTNLTGTVAIANEGAGIFVDNAPYNTVGGTTAAGRNVVSGNGNSGVFINGAIATDNLVQGNYVGTNAGGTAAIANTKGGVTLDNAPNNTIGGTAAGSGNLISGNGEDGVQIVGTHATGNVVQGNSIGTNHNSTSAVGNKRSGILVDHVSQQTIGGDTTQARNVISGNGANGVHINGATAISITIQANYIGTDVNGTAAVPNRASGVLLTSAPNNTIGGTTAAKRNVISGNGGDGIKISGSSASDNMVIGNYIGTDTNGTAGLGNGAAGVLLDGAPNNTVGGTSAAERNLISGNGTHGVRIFNSTATNNTVLGNHIGTDVNGTSALGNRQHGVEISGAPQNMVGGAVAGAGNLVSGNGVVGVAIVNATAISNTVEGNYIGTDVNGTAAVPNLASGVLLTSAPNNTIGGTTAAKRNVISGNGGDGIKISGSSASDNMVIGNYIGTDTSGTAGLGNGAAGVLLDGAPHNTVGGTSAAERNLISGNGTHGVRIFNSTATNNTVLGNHIGTDANGTSALGNRQHGVEISAAPQNMVGGAVAGAGNLISGNGVAGVAIVNATATSNTVEGNYIGTDVNGTAALSNDGPGVLMDGANQNRIGGTATGAGNLISGNAGTGISLQTNATQNLVHGNKIGTDKTGTHDLGNAEHGVSATGSSHNSIGGNGASEANLISGNDQHGVEIRGGGHNLVQGNRIGTDTTGALDLGNTWSGVGIIGSHDNLIGGTEGTTASGPCTGTCNLVSGNDAQGIYISLADSQNNLVQGNYVGTNAAGDAALSNGESGVSISEAPNNTVGGSSAGTANLLSGNNAYGLQIAGSQATGNLVQGNHIGTSANGNEVLANSQAGVHILNAPDNTIGGTATGTGNLVSGNAKHGIVLEGAGSSANLVQGNHIGTNAAGDAALPNSQHGMWIALGAHSNTIGGTDSGAGNLISGNGQSGVYIEHSETMTNTVQGNLIGTQANGTDSLGNGGAGVYVKDALNNSIGSDAPGASNVIAFNAGDGVTIYHSSLRPDAVHSPGATTTTTGNEVWGNSIFANGDLGIDLGADDGVTANDPQDPDTGANLLQNYPIIGSATSGFSVHITGTLNSLITTTFRLDFYNSDACDPSGFGEGASYVGSITATTNISGNVAFDAMLATTLPISSVVSATATDPEGNTSEFSECEVVRPAYWVYLPIVVRNYP